MSNIIIDGGRRLNGEISIQGAKNSALPLLAATILCKGETVLHNCPKLSDVDASMKILEHIGCKCIRENRSVIIDSSTINCCSIPHDLMREMRSSIVFLGAIVSRCKEAILSSPGGCELGPRPIDLHLSALRKMGLVINEDHGFLNCKAENGLKGETINLVFPSVGATENIMLAATLAKGTTKIFNAAREPEIIDVADFLNKCGGKIYGAGTDVIEIEGVTELFPTEHKVIPDRIIAATYMSAVAVTGGDVSIIDVIPSHISQVCSHFCEAGCNIVIDGNILHIKAPERLIKIPLIKTLPYPGFPTDAGPPLLAAATVADGTSIFVENIFENRFKCVDELKRLGARIKVEGRVAIVEGVERLTGATVEATDLRGGAALIIAALAAQGVTRIGNINHIDRGHEDIELNLLKVGASIKRE